MKRIRILLLALAVTVVAAGHASAQNIIISQGANNAIWGLKAPVWNSTDSTIVDGMLVQLDTTTAATSNNKVFVVKRYTGLVPDRAKVLGVAAGNIRRSSQTGNGSVLIWGYHPGIYTSLSNSTAGSPIRISSFNGAVRDGGDSLSLNVGWCISPVAGVFTGSQQGATPVRYKIKAFVNFLTPKNGP